MIRVVILAAVLMAAAFRANGQLLYKVEGNGLTGPSYIFGTHHLAPLSTLDSISGAEEAFESCAAVVGEIDMTVNPARLAAAMQPYMVAPADSTLSKVIPPESYPEVSARFLELTGIPFEAFEGMKPRVAMTAASALIVSREMEGFVPGEQLDTYFQARASAEHKTVIPLETAEEQAEILYGTTGIAAQARELIELINDKESLIDTSRRLNAAYAAGDLDTLYSIGLADENDPEFMEKILEGRNRAWAAKLPDIMARGQSFIAVGALHLPGEEGLLSLLRKRGYAVTAM